MIEIYTDGSCNNRHENRPGGYGIFMTYKKHTREIAKGYCNTSNNRMELMAVIVAIESLRRTDIPVRIHSDSEYVINAIKKKWVFSWELDSFAGRTNADLWKRFLEAYRKFKDGMIKMEWVRGHNGNPGNERADKLAGQAAKKEKLIRDIYQKKK